MSYRAVEVIAILKMPSEGSQCNDCDALPVTGFTVANYHEQPVHFSWSVAMITRHIVAALVAFSLITLGLSLIHISEPTRPY